MIQLIAGSVSTVDVATSSPSPSIISNIVFTVDAFYGFIFIFLKESDPNSHFPPELHDTINSRL